MPIVIIAREDPYYRWFCKLLLLGFLKNGQGLRMAYPGDSAVVYF